MFGQKLREARKQNKLTLDELAKLYNIRFNGGLSKGTLSKYENNLQEPMITTVGNLAAILGVSVDFLIGDEPLEFPSAITYVEENTVIYSRNGKTIQKKFTKEQMDYLDKFISSISNDDSDL